MLFSKVKEAFYDWPQELPGEQAQFKMAPIGRARIKNLKQSAADSAQSAVLVAIYPKNELAHTVLIRRNEYPGVHSGQVSFPGGKTEPDDPGFEHTALREADEEIGLRDVHIVGKLTELYIPPSKFFVHPFVGFFDSTPVFTPDSKEVQEVIELSLTELLDDGLIETNPMRLASGFSADVPYFNVEGHMVWGATAMILSELKALLAAV